MDAKGNEHNPEEIAASGVWKWKFHKVHRYKVARQAHTHINQLTYCACVLSVDMNFKLQVKYLIDEKEQINLAQVKKGIPRKITRISWSRSREN